MLRKIVLFAFFVTIVHQADSITLGNFTAQSYFIKVSDNNLNVLIENFVLNAQSYIDLGAIETPQLPLVVKVWQEDQTDLTDHTMLSEFAIEHVPSLRILVHNTDMWIIYTDENDELQITYLVQQPLDLKQNKQKTLVTTPKPILTSSVAQEPLLKKESIPMSVSELKPSQTITSTSEAPELFKEKVDESEKKTQQKDILQMQQAPLAGLASSKVPESKDMIIPTTKPQEKTNEQKKPEEMKEITVAPIPAPSPVLQSPDASLAVKNVKIEEKKEVKPISETTNSGQLEDSIENSEEYEMMPLSEPMIDEPMEELTPATKNSSIDVKAQGIKETANNK